MEPKLYVNGAMLADNIGRSVSVVGKVVSNNPSGLELTVQLSDGKEARVTLDEQLDEPLDGYIQFVAVVNNDLSLHNQAIVSFGAAEIDLDIYNEMINVSSRYPNLFSASELDGVTM